MKIKLDTRAIQSISLFHNITGASVVDCLEEGNGIFFVVAEDNYGLAVGKNGVKIKNAERIFKRMIKVFEYSPDLTKFVQNLIPETQETTINEKVIFVKLKPMDRAKVIGKGGNNIKVISKFLQRLFDIEELKIK